MEDKNKAAGPSDARIRKIMFLKKLSGVMEVSGFALIGIVILISTVVMLFGLEIQNYLPIFLMLLAVALIFMGDSLKKSALSAQRQMGIDRTPDEIEAERKEKERVKRLVSSPDAVNRELKKLAGWSKIVQKLVLMGLLFMLADIGILIVSAIFGVELPDSVPVLMSFMTIILLFPGSILLSYLSKRQKNLALHYTPGVLLEVMDRLDQYEPDGCVDQGYLWEDFAFGPRDRIGRRGDYVKGILKGMPVEFCEFELQYEAETKDEDGHPKKEIRTSFTGLMAVCRHGMKLSNHVTVTQFSRYRDEVKTESIEFTRAFSVKDVSGHDTFLVLTPQFMERMMALIREKQRRMGFQFRTDGVLLIVLKDADFFEAEDAENVAALKGRMESELLELADIMRQVGALTSEEIEAAAAQQPAQPSGI